MEHKTDTFVKFNPEGIGIGYRMYYKDEKGIFTGYIPGFDLVYSAVDLETLRLRADSMIKHFFDYWIEQESWKQLILKLHKLGFRAEMHDMQMKKLLNNQRPSSTKFEAKPQRKLEEVFATTDDINSFSQEKELAY